MEEIKQLVNEIEAIYNNEMNTELQKTKDTYEFTRDAEIIDRLYDLQQKGIVPSDLEQAFYLHGEKSKDVEQIFYKAA
ncbi:hypothetical protein HQ545_05830 [Candidatus Woesearchaeota archaeon]|nr:hypothetical protein [Candidatus Woesearchaeota archaeon]